MGLIQAAKDTLETLMADQWREYFYCDALSDDVLVRKAQKKNNKNNKGSDNIISDGSIVVVNEGQCMIIVEQGQIVDFCAQAGPFVYNTSTEPSLLNGEIPDGSTIMETFKLIGRRFTFGGSTANDQRVYYFNIKEIKNNLFGTRSPVDFNVVKANMGIDMSIKIRMNGNYCYKIVDPLLFYKEICGNVEHEYKRSDLTEQLKNDVLGVLQPALTELSRYKIMHTEILAYNKELLTAVNNALGDTWKNRGIQMTTINIGSVNPTESDLERIQKAEDEFRETAKYLATPGMLEAKERLNRSEALMAAASNTATGPMFAFGAMNMAGQMGNQMSSMNVTPVVGVQGGQVQAAAAVTMGWTCSCGQQDNRGNFCTNCGGKRPDAAGWTCSCGHSNTGRFCTNCGMKKPAGAPMYKCDKCGWEPENPAQPPKFCPECGDVFDDSDLK